MKTLTIGNKEFEIEDEVSELIIEISKERDSLISDAANKMNKEVIERNLKASEEARKVFKIGDWVFGIGEHEGCSEVFEGAYKDFQPFSYLDDFNPNNYRLATKEEITQAR